MSKLLNGLLLAAIGAVLPQLAMAQDKMIVIKGNGGEVRITERAYQRRPDWATTDFLLSVMPQGAILAFNRDGEGCYEYMMEGGLVPATDPQGNKICD